MKNTNTNTNKKMERVNTRIVNGYELFTNLRNGGIQCVFEHNGKSYMVDLCYLRGYGIPTTECMVFGYNDDGTQNWTDLYCKRGISHTDASLVACIEEFKRDMQ